jgi:pyruvate/2-oxoglutarate dehydrogenase complex dihydrolipoamide dehydrogenase (E3) component
MTDTYDLIVVGAGMAGAAAANQCASAGWRVAIVDELPYGGTCALRGCDPKKILRGGAEIIDSLIWTYQGERCYFDCPSSKSAGQRHQPGMNLSK